MVWLLANLRLVAYGAAVAAILGLAYVVNEWRDDSAQLKVERSKFENDRTQLEYRLTQLGQMALRNYEASRGYQTQLLAANAQRDALHESVIGLQITARRFPAIEVLAPRRLDDPTPVPERDPGYAIDPQWLETYAYNCQADAEQLAAFQSLVLSQ